MVAFGVHAIAQQSKWVTTGVSGRLIYVPDADGDRVQDFAMVGYGAGKKPLPTGLPVVIHVNPLAGDNTQNIQKRHQFRRLAAAAGQRLSRRRRIGPRQV